jgi:DNA recombination protein RmuC
MLEVRGTLETKIRDLQTDNAKRLDEMRQTVDEKLHATLETRLTESFRHVSERLEKVHQGLGEMQQLALGVGDLKRVLTNVKTRGTWGEVQLQMLLEQVLTADQYASNVETVSGSNARVEFAIKLPGMTDGGPPVWLPIDAKFPKEQYERLVEAAEHADADGVARAGAELERAVRVEAKTICEKYVSPPQTTDFAILFLPTEGLYAEVMRRPGLADDLQRTLRVMIAGPSTLSALLNSLQMGFRTLALEKRSSEVWQVLGAVKTEFGKFGDVLAATKTTLERAAKNIENAEVRSRQMARKLKSVEALPSEAAQLMLGTDPIALDE